MAKKLPDPLARRHLLERDLPESQALATAEAYLAAGRTVEAVDFLAKAGATEKLREIRAEAVAAGDPFLLALGFCLTDVYIAVVSRWAQQDAWRPEHLPRVERLTAAVAARPAAAPVWSRHRPDDPPARFT